MKIHNLFLAMSFIAFYSSTLIKGVDSQLDFGDSKESSKKAPVKDKKQGEAGLSPGPGQSATKLGPLKHHGHIQIIPQSVCIMKADPGYCNLIIGRWYYDHRYHRCLPFLYTGCGGNPNNFMSLKKCAAATHQCHFISTPFDPLTKHALLNPINPLSSLAGDYVLAG